jgi:hypothetical protein
MHLLPLQHFWRWFQRHQHCFLFLRESVSPDEYDYWMAELEAHVLACCSQYMSATIDLCSQTGKGRLVFRKTGPVPETLVEAVAASVPKIPGWHVLVPRSLKPTQGLYARDLFGSMMALDEENGFYGMMIFVPQEEEVSPELQEAVEMLVNQQLTNCGINPDKVVMAIENLSELRTDEDFFVLDELKARFPN